MGGVRLADDQRPLWRVSIEGGEPTPLVQGENFDALPSPSGRLILLLAFEWEERPVRVRLMRWIVISSSDRKRLFALDAPRAATIGMLPSLGAGRERPRLRRDAERRVEYLAAAAHRRATRADHALQRRKDLQLRVVARWPMAVARQRRQQKRRRPDVTSAIAARVLDARAASGTGLTRAA